MSREVDEQVRHDHVVELLYREYYNYPNPAQPHLLTFVNHPYKSRGARDEQGNELFPDILVFWPRTDRLMMVAEVETESTVNPEEAQEWESFSRLGANFYLYVPHGLGGVADLLCKDISVTELVEYRREDARFLIKRYR